MALTHNSIHPKKKKMKSSVGDVLFVGYSGMMAADESRAIAATCAHLSEGHKEELMQRIAVGRREDMVEAANHLATQFLNTVSACADSKVLAGKLQNASMIVTVLVEKLRTADVVAVLGDFSAGKHDLDVKVADALARCLFGVDGCIQVARRDLFVLPPGMCSVMVASWDSCVRDLREWVREQRWRLDAAADAGAAAADAGAAAAGALNFTVDMTWMDAHLLFALV